MIRNFPCSCCCPNKLIWPTSWLVCRWKTYLLDVYPNVLRHDQEFSLQLAWCVSKCKSMLHLFYTVLGTDEVFSSSGLLFSFYYSCLISVQYYCYRSYIWLLLVEMHLAKVSITWHITGLIFLSFTKDWKLMMNPIRRLTRKGKFWKYGMQIAFNSIKSRLLHKLWDILEDRKGLITRRDALTS
jgi:hypothetical protein